MNIVEEVKDLYNDLKNHPYINEITIKNGKLFHNEYTKIYKYLFGDESKNYEVDIDGFRRCYNIPELALLATETHDVNLMCSNLDYRYHSDGDDFNKMHHNYMMDILEIIGSLTGEERKEYINIWEDVRFKDGWKWCNYLYKVKEIKPGIYKAINCISETYVKDKLIDKYKETIDRYKNEGNLKYANYCQDELDDLENKTGIYHIVLPDDEYYKYAKYKKN